MLISIKVFTAARSSGGPIKHIVADIDWFIRGRSINKLHNYVMPSFVNVKIEKI